MFKIKLFAVALISTFFSTFIVNPSFAECTTTEILVDITPPESFRPVYRVSYVTTCTDDPSPSASASPDPSSGSVNGGFPTVDQSDPTLPDVKMTGWTQTCTGNTCVDEYKYSDGRVLKISMDSRFYGITKSINQTDVNGTVLKDIQVDEKVVAQLKKEAIKEIKLQRRNELFQSLDQQYTSLDLSTEEKNLISDFALKIDNKIPDITKSRSIKLPKPPEELEQELKVLNKKNCQIVGSNLVLNMNKNCTLVVTVITNDGDEVEVKQKIKRTKIGK
jgi:hypothetical protein